MGTMLTQVLIDSVDVTRYVINYEKEGTQDNCIAEIDISVVRNISELVTLSTGQTIEVYRGWTTAYDEHVFSGYIESFEADSGKIKITGKDRMWDLVRKEVTTIYDSSGAMGGKISAIFDDLVTTYGGLRTSATSIQDSGTTIILNRFICNHTDIMERCSNLSNVLTWQMYFDSNVFFTSGTNTTLVTNKLVDTSATFSTNIIAGMIVTNKATGLHANVVSVDSDTTITLDSDIFLTTTEAYSIHDMYVYFEPKGYTVNPITFTVGDNIYNVPKWTYDVTEMINDLTIVGAYQEVEVTESGRIGTTSGYTTSGITLNYTPISIKPYIDANNPPTTLRVVGIPNSTLTYYCYVDKPNKLLLPAVGTSFTSNDYAIIQYSHAVPIPVHMYNQASINTYGQFKKTITFNDLRDVNDAENRGANLMNNKSTPYLLATLKVKSDSSYGLDVGQSILVVDNINTPNINQNMVITRHRIRYPADYDELVVGDKSYRQANWQSSVEERLKRLAEEQLANQDLLTELVDINNDASIIPRYLQLSKGAVLYYLCQGNDVYTETFFDTKFKSSADADWNTTGKYLNFDI